jgi:large subunit ribosomal protein L17
LSRNTSHRRALLRNLVTDLLEHGRLMTTLPKAKEVRPLAEKMITLGKRDSLHARRQVQSYLMRDGIAKTVFDTIAPRFADRNGGYCRIIKLGNRKGDGADLAIIELLGSELEVKKAERAEKAKEKASKKPKEDKEEE